MFYTETLIRHYFVVKGSKDEAVWLSGQCVGLAIRHSWVRILRWPLDGFVLSHPNFKSFATLENSQLDATCQLGYLILLGSI